MNRWTDQHRSIVAAQRAYRRLNNVAKPPSERVIRRCVVLFREFGNVHDTHRSGRPKTSRTPTNIEMVREDVTTSPQFCEVTFNRASDVRNIFEKDNEG